MRQILIHAFTALLLLTSLTACNAKDKDEVPVPISGINYSDKEINGYLFVDPNNEDKYGGGEGLNPYSAGGIMCCYSLPKKWRAGIKVGLWVDNLNGTNDRTKVIIEIPPYPDGKAGNLWAIIYPDGSLGAVSTNFGPDNEKWPGKIKGWPVPSLEYRRFLWEMDLKEKQGFVENAQNLLDELKNEPAKRLYNAWASSRKFNEKVILEKFQGPNDPAYKEFLLKEYEKYLRETQQKVDDWMKVKP